MPQPAVQAPPWQTVPVPQPLPSKAGLQEVDELDGTHAWQPVAGLVVAGA